jgi:hypothetical protein
MHQLINLYLDYKNNFLTVGSFAEYYGLDHADALQIIHLGKKYHNQQTKVKNITNKF